jgi:PIN domain nuclease of toxin-antitoxin system
LDELQRHQSRNRVSITIFTRKAKIILRNPVSEDLGDRLNLKICAKDFNQVISHSLDLHWTRDPFDRLIVAHAAVNNNILLTKDQTILANYAQGQW